MNEALYVIVPCYNEEEALPVTAGVLKKILDGIIADGLASKASRILLVDDGSSDATWDVIRSLHVSDPAFIGLRLARNAGHQEALSAGLRYARGRCGAAVSIDADLQDDPGAIREMAVQWRGGHDVVYGVRSSRRSDTVLKRMTAEGYYKLLAAMGVDVVFNHADFRLLSWKALEYFSMFDEKGPFLRGLVPSFAHDPAVVEYERRPRTMGESKYPVRRMLSLAADGAFGSSLKPVRLVAFAGAGLFGLSMLAMLVGLLSGAMSSQAPVLCSIWGAAGLVMLGTGVAGEYAGRAYLEAKHRPGHFVWETLDDET